MIGIIQLNMLNQQCSNSWNVPDCGRNSSMKSWNSPKWAIFSWLGTTGLDRGNYRQEWLETWGNVTLCGQ